MMIIGTGNLSRPCGADLLHEEILLTPGRSVLPTLARLIHAAAIPCVCATAASMGIWFFSVISLQKILCCTNEKLLFHP